MLYVDNDMRLIDSVELTDGRTLESGSTHRFYSYRDEKEDVVYYLIDEKETDDMDWFTAFHFSELIKSYDERDI